MSNEAVMALAMAKESESFRSHKYRCPANKLTQGYGRNLEVYPLSEDEKKELDADGGVSEAVAEKWAIKELLECEDKLKANIIYTKQSDIRKAILLDMCFNIGYGGLMKFKKMWFALGNREFTQAGQEMKNSAWYEQVGLRAKRNVAMMIKNSFVTYADIEQ